MYMRFSIWLDEWNVKVTHKTLEKTEPSKESRETRQTGWVSIVKTRKGERDSDKDRQTDRQTEEERTIIAPSVYILDFARETEYALWFL